MTMTFSMTTYIRLYTGRAGWHSRAKQGRSDGGVYLYLYPPKSAQVNFLWAKNDVRTAIQQFYTPKKVLYPQNKFMATPLGFMQVSLRQKRSGCPDTAGEWMGVYDRTNVKNTKTECSVCRLIIQIFHPCLLLSPSTGYQIFKHRFQISNHVRAWL